MHRQFAGDVALYCFAMSLFAATLPADDAATIRHSYLVMGAKTAIINEMATCLEYRGGSRDGFVLPNGNVLLAFSNRVEEVTRDKQVVFSYDLSRSNSEIGTTQRLYNGNTLVTELGAHPKLLEIATDQKIVREILLEPETENAHMQTRMAAS